jgi:hypothetical protein
LHQQLQPKRLRPLMRFEPEQKSGALFVDFFHSVTLSSGGFVDYEKKVIQGA